MTSGREEWVYIYIVKESLRAVVFSLVNAKTSYGVRKIKKIKKHYFVINTE
jgi:hypothetical protein